MRPHDATRTALALLLVGLVLSTTGCAPERLTEAREYEVDQLSLEYESIGDQLIAQIAPSERMGEPRFTGRGGGLSLDPFDRNGWPRNTGWGARIQIAGDGPRTPLQIKDGLEEWLLVQGWRKPDSTPYLSSRGKTHQSFVRGGALTLRVEATTDPPPNAQYVEISLGGVFVN